MPQTNVIQDWKATYPYDAPRMKPSAVLGTVTRVASASSWAAGVVTLTVPATTDYIGSVYTMTVSGFTPAGYNGVVQGTIASATTITYPLASSPGASTVQGQVSYTGMVPVNMSTTLGANDVPNKPTYSAGTIQSFETFMEAVAEWDAKQAEAKTAAEEAAGEEEPVEEEEEVEEDDGNGGTTKRRRPKSRRR
jgi:hypothetical protein